MKSQFISLLKQETGAEGLKIITVAIIAGLLQGLVMVIINGAASNLPEGGLNFRYLGMFICCIAGFIYTKRYSLSKNVERMQHILFNNRIRIADKIRHSSLIHIEEIGRSQLYTALADNTEIIFSASRQLANAGSSTVMVIFSFIYIGHLSGVALLLAIFFIIGGISIYMFNQQASNQELITSREKESEFFTYLNHLLNGFKEVKINSEKSRDLFENHLRETSYTARDLKIKTEYRFVDNYIFAQSFFYMLMASIIFLLPQITNSPPGTIINITAVVLFMIGPLGDIVEAIPMVAKADVAVGSIQKIENYLDSANDSKDFQASNRISRKTGFNQITLQEIYFFYGKDTNKFFSVGPMDLTVQAGEIIFIVGGNGSGKSTLLKILAGLYYPASGKIMVDNIPVDMTNYADYRNLYSIVFTDFHLFDKFYGMPTLDVNMLYDLLDKMQLTEKTSYSDGRFTNINLSTGQKKRLAMIISYLEDKPIFIFDEVAADQDPVYRQYFYEVFLKDLKAKGKTIIAASHDDRYFSMADRVLKMEFGQFITISSKTKRAAKRKKSTKSEAKQDSHPPVKE